MGQAVVKSVKECQGPLPERRYIAVNTAHLPEGIAAEILELAHDAVICASLDGNIVHCNFAAQQIFGYDRSELLGKPIEFLMPDHFAAQHRKHVSSFLGGPVAAMSMDSRGQLIGRRKDGSEFPARAAISVTGLGQARLLTVILADVSEATALAEAAQTGAMFSKAIMDTVAGLIVVLDLDGSVCQLNRAAHLMLESIGVDPSDWICECYVGLIRSAFYLESGGVEPADKVRELVAGTRRQFDLDLAVRLEDGNRWFHLVARTMDGDQGFVISHRDITHRKIREELLSKQAWADSLTGLVNRAGLTDYLEKVVQRATRQQQAALIFIDINNFKTVNDTLTHEAGDALLCETARRLEQIGRPNDVVARFGGDEFVMLCEDVTSIEDAMGIAVRIRDAIASPFCFKGQQLHVTSSIGVAVAQTQPEQEFAKILNNADVAMYEAKRRGRSQIVLFNSTLGDDMQRRWNIEQELVGVLGRGELKLNYHPVVNLTDGKMTAAEALLRWSSPSLGTVQPAEFIPIAEAAGMMVDIGSWVLQEASQQMRRWAQRDGTPQRLSINVSASQLNDPNFADTVTQTFASAQVDPKLMCLEITETALISNPEMTATQLYKLNNCGVTIALDDFGTGFGALIDIARFPISCLKIDRSFVQGLEKNKDNETIVRSIVTLARGLDLHLVAEGVESDYQRRFLLQQGCRQGQGFLFSQVIAPDDPYFGSSATTATAGVASTASP